MNEWMERIQVFIYIQTIMQTNKGSQAIQVQQQQQPISRGRGRKLFQAQNLFTLIIRIWVKQSKIIVHVILCEHV